MPELPEVETIVARLRGLVADKQILEAQVWHPKSFQGDFTELTGARITELQRRGKMIRARLSPTASGRTDLNLLIHLKMTGQLIYVDQEIRAGGGHPTADWVHDLPSKHTRVAIKFANGATLFFNDQRVFGWIRLLSDAEVNQAYAKLAPDIIDPSLTADSLLVHTQRRGIPIKQLVMDNSMVAGVGNIYACDALNLAQLSPWRPARSLSPTDAQTLLNAMQTVIQRGIELKGATIDNFSHVDGFAGGYQQEARVYGREGQECYNCGSLISKQKLAGRGTYFCATCQV